MEEVCSSAAVSVGGTTAAGEPGGPGGQVSEGEGVGKPLHEDGDEDDGGGEGGQIELLQKNGLSPTSDGEDHSIISEKFDYQFNLNNNGNIKLERTADSDAMLVAMLVIQT